MLNRLIRISYRKIIDASSAGAWEKLVFADSYLEFKMQFQYFDQEKKYRSFGELLSGVPSASSMHFLVSGAITGYIQQLNGRVPDILNNQGRHFLKFTDYQFEVINSDITDISKHQIAVNFYSGELRWHDTIGNRLLVSEPGAEGQDVLTDLFELQPFLSIYSLKEL